MAWAFGIAGTQSSGFREMFGTMCKSLHPGLAARNGLASALLAQQNFTSSDRVLEAPRGFAHVMSTARDFSQITDGLGRTFAITRDTYKPFACGIVIHPTIDACVELGREHRLTGDEIERIDLRVAPLVLELTGKRAPRVGLEGKFSVFHSAAVAILHRQAGEREYSDACVWDPRVIALRDRVHATVDQSVRDDEAYVRMTLKNGDVLERHVEHAIGSLERPQTDEDLGAKFSGLTADILPREQSDRLLDLCWRIQELPDVSELSKASVPDGRR
jgi:2-methylcitrate dehydratase PrpD